MKKNNLLPIILVAGAGVAAYFYFKNKGKAKEFSNKIDVEPIDLTKDSNVEDMNTTETQEGNEPVTKVESYIKTGSQIINAGKQLLKGRKKRRARVEIGPTESSSSPFSDVPGSTRKQKRTLRKTARTEKRTLKRTARTEKRATRKQRRAVKGFDDLSVLY